MATRIPQPLEFVERPDATSLEIVESGEAISAPEPQAAYALKVETNDPTAQIVVLNDRFDAVVKAAGSVSERLPAGIYKVRVRRGASSTGFEDRLVILDRDRSISIVPPQLSSPAPIGGSRASEAHVAASEWLDAVVHESVGRGSKIAVLARYAARSRGSTPLLHPFRGLQLLRADGRTLVELERTAPKFHLPDSGDPISICGIQVDPGAYILRYQLSNHRQLSQSVVAIRDWQITISIRRPDEADEDAEPLAQSSAPNTERGEALFGRPGYVTLLMRRLTNGQSAEFASPRNSEDGSIDDDRLVEVARQGLADGAQLLSGNLYDLLLRDFENPMAGIIGGLLLDVEREALGAKFVPEHAALFDTVVRKLREMVGREHPDVEALSFRCQDPSLAHQGAINARPMFHRSWRMILEAAAQRHDLVPLDLWRRTSASGSMPPYLIWSADQAGKQARLRQLRKTASHLSTLRIAWPGASASLESLVTPAARARAASASGAPKLKPAKISREEIALEMGVPANALVQLIQRPKLLARSLSRATAEAGAPKKSGERAPQRFVGKKLAAKKVVHKSATFGAAKAGAAWKPGSAGVKAVPKKAVAGKKGAGSLGKSASTKARAGAKRAGRVSRRKPARARQ